MEFNEQLEFLAKLDVYITKRAERLIADIPKQPYQSPSLVNLLGALSKAQGEYQTIKFNRKDAYFEEEYVDFDSIMQSVRPILAHYGLSVIQQQQITPDGATMLHTILGHESGEWVESRTRILPIKEGPTGYASELMFQKRHAVMCLLGISVTNDMADDNAYVAMQPIRTKVERGTALNVIYEEQAPTAQRDSITKEQLEELEYELAQYPDLAKMILDQWKLQALADMPKSKYMKAIHKVREIKLLRSGVKV
jgi:hypothetical protein